MTPSPKLQSMYRDELAKIEAMVECPDCEGEGGWGVVTGVIATPHGPEETGWWETCPRCKGTGGVTPAQASREEAVS